MINKIKFSPILFYFIFPLLSSRIRGRVSRRSGPYIKMSINIPAHRAARNKKVAANVSPQMNICDGVT